MAVEERIVLLGDREIQAALERVGRAGDVAFQNVARSATRASLQLTSVAAKAVDVGEAMQRVGRNLSLYVTAPLTLLGTLSVRSFAAFEKGLIGVGKTTNLAGQELQDLGQRIRGISRDVPVAVEELLEIAQASGQLGVTGADNISLFTETVGKLGLATNLAGEEAATMLARILTITGEGLDTVDRFGATLVDLGNNFAATEREIAVAATRVAQSTAQFGVSAANISGIATALAAVGVRAEAGGTVIGRAFQAINDAVRGGGEAAQALAQITGKSVQEMSQIFEEDSTRAFQLLVEGLGRIHSSGGDVASALKELGLEGVRVVAVMGTLAARTNVLDSALTTANRAWEENTALNEEARRAAESFSAQMTLFGNVIKDAGAALGEGLVPTIKLVTAIIRQLAEAFIALPFPVRFLIAHVLALTAAVGPLLVAFQFLTSNLGRALFTIALFPRASNILVGTFTRLMGVVALLTRGFQLLRVVSIAGIAALSGFPLLLAAVAAAVGFLAVYLAQNSEAVTAWFSNYSETLTALSALWESFEAFLAELLQSILAVFASTFQQISEGVAIALDAMVRPFVAFKERVQRVYEDLRDFVLDVFDRIQRVSENLFGGASARRPQVGGGGFRQGGAIGGVGTSTSDSNLIWASRGEFVQPARAVRHYGLAFMEAIRTLRFDPGQMALAMGGLVDFSPSPAPRVRFADGGLVGGGGRNVLNLTIGGERFDGLTAPDEAFDRLEKYAIRQSVRSIGRKPRWHGK